MTIFSLEQNLKTSGVICEPCFTGSLEIFELRKNVDHKKIPNFVNQNFVNQTLKNQKRWVHTQKVHKIQVHVNLMKFIS